MIRFKVNLVVLTLAIFNTTIFDNGSGDFYTFVKQVQIDQNLCEHMDYGHQMSSKMCMRKCSSTSQVNIITTMLVKSVYPERFLECMCIGVHDIARFGDQSAKTEKSEHLILVTKANIWCATVMAKNITSIFTTTYSP